MKAGRSGDEREVRLSHLPCPHHYEALPSTPATQARQRADHTSFSSARAAQRYSSTPARSCSARANSGPASARSASLAWVGTLDGDICVVGEAMGLAYGTVTRAAHRVRTTQQQKVTLGMIDRAFTAAEQPHMLAILYPQDVVDGGSLVPRVAARARVSARSLRQPDDRVAAAGDPRRP